MRHTQDLVLARLRELGRRWRSPQPTNDGWNSIRLGGSASAGSEMVAEGIDDGAAELAAVAGEAEPAVDRGGRTPWVWLIGLLAALALSGAGVAAFLAWPKAVADPEPAPVVDAGRSGSGSSDPAGIASAPADPFAVPSATPTSVIVVHVAGDVRHPGIVRLPPGSRVVDAVEAAGGLIRGGSWGAVNLARILADGERVEVGAEAPAEGSGSGPVGGTAPGAVGASSPIDLNTATAEQLDTLPGIGPVTAAKILAWRSEHGRFTAIDELAEVSGIGPKTLEELRPHVRV